MALVFSVVMTMNVNGEQNEEGERNVEERTAGEQTAVRENEKQEHEEDRFDLWRGRVRPHCASMHRGLLPRVYVRATAALPQPAHAWLYNAP